MKKSSPTDYIHSQVLLLPFGLLYILIAVSAFLPEYRLWGINHLAFYTIPVRIAALILIALSFIPFLNRPAYKQLLNVFEYLSVRRRFTLAVILAAAVLSFLVFLHFQSATLLLGDGQLVVSNLEMRIAREDPSIFATLREILRTDRISPGTSFLYYFLTKVLLSVSKMSPTDTIKLFNSLLGGILVGIMLFIAWRSSSRSELRIWLLLLVLFSGTVQLFFGYVENYSLFLFLGALYLITAINCIHGKGSLWLPVVLVVLSIISHIQGILLVPSLVLLVAWSFAKTSREALLRFMTPILAILTAIVAYLSSAHTNLSRFFLPIFRSEESYGLLSMAHWIDIANQLLILVPILLFFVFIAGWMAIPSVKSRLSGSGDSHPTSYEEKTPEPARWLTLNVEWHFVTIVLVPSIIYLIFFKPEIGMSRDWDLFSIVALGLIPLSLLLFNRLLRLALAPAMMAMITVPALIMSLMLTIAWVGINSNPSRSITRLEQTLAYDQSRAAYIYETLSIYYMEANRLADAIDVLEKATAIKRNPRLLFNLSLLYDDVGNIERSNRLLRRILNDHPRFPRARQLLVISLYSQRRCADVVEVARVGTELNPENPLFHFYLGKCLVLLGQREEGAKALEEAKQLKPPTKMLRDIKSILEQIGVER